jgi:hypothetical protein
MTSITKFINKRKGDLLSKTKRIEYNPITLYQF